MTSARHGYSCLVQRCVKATGSKKAYGCPIYNEEIQHHQQHYRIQMKCPSKQRAEESQKFNDELAYPDQKFRAQHKRRCGTLRLQ